MRGEIIFNLVVMCLSFCWTIYLQYRQWYKQKPIKNFWGGTVSVLFPLSGMWLMEDLYDFPEWWQSMVIAISISFGILVIAKWGFTCMRKSRG